MIKPTLKTVNARVTLVIEVPAKGSWGADCNLEQVFRQAGEETANGVSNALLSAGIRCNIVSKQVHAMAAVSEEWK